MIVLLLLSILVLYYLCDWTVVTVACGIVGLVWPCIWCGSMVRYSGSPSGWGGFSPQYLSTLPFPWRTEGTVRAALTVLQWVWTVSAHVLLQGNPCWRWHQGAVPDSVIFGSGGLHYRKDTYSGGREARCLHMHRLPSGLANCIVGWCK